MRISTKTENGMRACFVLAMHEGEIVPIGEIVRMTSVTPKYLEKILSILVKSGIVTTRRGASGGYSLAKLARDVSVGEIVRVLEDDLKFTDCVGGTCADAYCPNRSIFQKLYQSMNSVLDGYMLEDLVMDNTCKK